MSNAVWKNQGTSKDHATLVSEERRNISDVEWKKKKIDEDTERRRGRNTKEVKHKKTQTKRKNDSTQLLQCRLLNIYTMIVLR